jgi:hypothetical protein
MSASMYPTPVSGPAGSRPSRTRARARVLTEASRKRNGRLKIVLSENRRVRNEPTGTLGSAVRLAICCRSHLLISMLFEAGWPLLNQPNDHRWARHSIQIPFQSKYRGRRWLEVVHQVRRFVGWSMPEVRQARQAGAAKSLLPEGHISTAFQRLKPRGAGMVQSHTEPDEPWNLHCSRSPRLRNFPLPLLGKRQPKMRKM